MSTQTPDTYIDSADGSTRHHAPATGVRRISAIEINDITGKELKSALLHKNYVELAYPVEKLIAGKVARQERTYCRLYLTKWGTLAAKWDGKMRDVIITAYQMETCRSLSFKMKAE